MGREEGQGVGALRLDHGGQQQEVTLGLFTEWMGYEKRVNTCKNTVLLWKMKQNNTLHLLATSLGGQDVGNSPLGGRLDSLIIPYII